MLGSIDFRIRRNRFFNVMNHGNNNGSALLGLVSRVCCPGSNRVQIRNGLIPFVRLKIKFGPRLANQRGICLGNTLLKFSHRRISTVCSSVISFTRLSRFVSRGLGGCSSNVRIQLTFSITVGTRNSVLILSRILTIKSRTFRHGYGSCFARVGGSPAGAIVLIARSVDTVGQCYAHTVFVRSNIITTVNSERAITRRCALTGLRTRRQGRRRHEGVISRGGSRCPGNLGTQYPLLQACNISPLVLGDSSAFAFTIRCRCSRPNSFCLTVTVRSIQHNNVACSANTGAVGVRGRKRRAMCFRVPLGLFGSNRFELVASLHAPAPNSSHVASTITITLSSGTYAFIVHSSHGHGCTLLDSETLAVARVRRPGG